MPKNKKGAALQGTPPKTNTHDDSRLVYTPRVLIDPICGRLITAADQLETQRLIVQFLAAIATIDDGELRFANAEVAS